MKINKKEISVDLRTRLAIFEVLEKILNKKQNFDTAFDEVLRTFPSFEGRDIGFIREAVMSTLRRLGQIDDCLQALSDRALDKLEPSSVLTLLRIGAVQLLFMDVKSHAAVDTVVRLAAVMNLDKQKGFINGVLRNLDRKRDELLKKHEGKEGEINTPDWLYKIWLNDYGPDVAKQIADAHLMPAPVDITVRSDPEKWAEQLGGQVLPNGSIRMEKSGRIPDLEGYSEGEWWVQSASAALPVQVMNVSPGDHIVDLCAAPGGKTMQLAAAGAKVSAVDISKNRLNRLRENLERCKLSAEVEASDGKVWMPKRPVDAVLIDAPCSATGTIRHQPDVLHLKQKKDIDKLVQTQKEILAHAAKFVKRGGQIIYCTCSVQKSESEDIVSEFLNKNNGFEIKPYAVGELKWLQGAVTDQGFIRVLPQHFSEKGGMDGFFIARMIRL